MIQLIVTDMDGTLLDSDKRLPADFTNVYEGLRDKGVRFAVASGRQYYTLRDEFSHLDHDILFVAENGGFIKWDNGEKVISPIPMSKAAELVAFLRQITTASVVLCGKDSAYIESDEAHFMTEVNKYYKRHKVVKDLTLVNDEILKIAVCDFSHLETTTYQSVSKFANDFQVSTSSHIWLDIMSGGVNKGEAIRFLQQELSITPEETMVFGDYLNDLEMMSAAHYSFAMANAHADIKQVARFQTVSNDENGVMKAIREHVKI